MTTVTFNGTSATKCDLIPVGVINCQLCLQMLCAQCFVEAHLDCPRPAPHDELDKLRLRALELESIVDCVRGNTLGSRPLLESLEPQNRELSPQLRSDFLAAHFL